MSKPVRRPNSRYFYFIKEVPADLRDIVGKTKVKVSLKTTDPVEAEVRNDELDILWTGNFASLRSGIISLTHRQRVAVAGVLYRQCVEQYRDEPDAFLQVPGIALWPFIADDPDARVLVAGKKEITDALVRSVKAMHRGRLSDFLVGEGLRLSDEEFDATLVFVNRAMNQSLTRIMRYRKMDYAPDPWTSGPCGRGPCP